MSEHVVFDNVPEIVQPDVERAWQRHRRRLRRLLRTFPEDQRHLRLTVRQHHGRYEVKATVMLPTGTLVAHAEQLGGFVGALKQAADRLREEIRRHKERLRHEHEYRRHRPSPAKPMPVVERLAELVAAPDREAFFDVLRPLFGELSAHAHQEIVLAQLEGRVSPGELTVGELIDEALARAWDRFDERPGDGSLEGWLVTLMHEALDARCSEPVAEHLEDTLPPDDPRFEADTTWITENNPFWMEPSPPTLEDVVSGDEVPTPWRALEARDQRRWVLRQLRDLPRDQRRAFALHTLEGWLEEEIGLLQGRGVEAVRADIGAARRALLEKLSASDPASWAAAGRVRAA